MAIKHHLVLELFEWEKHQPAWRKDGIFSHSHSVHTGYGAHPTSYPIDTGVF